MEHIHRETEQQIWQRVVRPPENRIHDLDAVLRMSAEAASAYRDLARDSVGKTKETLIALMEGEKANIAAMKGILFFLGCRIPVIRFPSAARQPKNRLLFRIIQLGKASYTEYASRMAEPEFGQVFQTLAQREQKQITKALELLGEMEKDG